jgi:prepilin-type processing-associated H-X9-DG protein
VHALHDARKYLPPLSAPCADPANAGCYTPVSHPYGRHNYTMFHFLLPYIEQNNVLQMSAITGYAGGQYFRTMTVLICPADPSIEDGKNRTAFGGANNWGASSIAGNNYVFGDPQAGNTWGKSRMPASIGDGTSNTIFFGEVYGTCGNSGDINNLWGSLWADANSIWRPAYNLANGSKGAVRGYPAARLPQDRPKFIFNCDPNRTQSGHDGGINVCMGDGSVRFVTTSISGATWAAANDPRDGVPLGSDW